LWENKRQILTWACTLPQHLVPSDAQGARQITLSEIRDALTKENAAPGSIICIEWVSYPYVAWRVDEKLKQLWIDEDSGSIAELKRKKNKTT